MRRIDKGLFLYSVVVAMALFDVLAVYSTMTATENPRIRYIVAIVACTFVSILAGWVYEDMKRIAIGFLSGHRKVHYWLSIGRKMLFIQVDQSNLPEVPEQRDGEHLWTVLGAWRIIRPEREGPVSLDTENLMNLVGPACFYCELMYSPRLAQRRCAGNPEGKKS
jgi:hypothetical protein